MPAELFIDTSGWYPLADPTHPDHPALARELRRLISRGVRPVTTNLVVAETHALIMRRAHRAAALAFLREVRRPLNLVVTSDAEVESLAERDWLERFSDQDLSLTDAVSFTVMAERKIREALALDEHFATAGYVIVPS